MASDWSTLRETLLTASGKRGLERALREAIRSGRLAAGLRLPSTRDLAAQLNVARGTVTSAYDQLAAEGYLVVQRGSGTRVAPLAPEEPVAAEQPTFRYHLGPGMPSLASFPRQAWASALRGAVTGLPDVDLGYADPMGFPALRQELAAYLGRVRAVSATAEDVVITHGTFDGIGLLASSLKGPVAIEDPGGPDQAEMLAMHALDYVAIPVDEDGIRVDLLAQTACRTVIVTAAHQFPMGVALHPQRRRALVEWAIANDGIIIEDDYDAEYRYDRPSVGALQALCPNRVVYVGTLSKTLAPAIRLGWMVVPAALRQDLPDRRWHATRSCGTFEQAAFATLLRNGAYDRHLRRTRLLYRERRDALLRALRRYVPGWGVVGIDAGLHVVVLLPPGITEDVVGLLAAQRIQVSGLSEFAHRDDLAPGLVLGFGAMSPAQLDEAIAAVAQAVKS